jgi:hypothetical protein
MQELFNLAIHPLNLIYSFLLALVMLYWLSVIFGALDMSAFDFDLDVDVDVDPSVEVDPSVDLGAGWFAGAMHFLHFDRLPFMLIMSFVIVSAWSMSVLSNHYWGNYSGAFALAMTGPIILASFMVAKVLSYPFIPLFAAVNQAAEPVAYIGRECRIKLPPVENKFGTASVEHSGDQLLVNIKTLKPNQLLKPGQSALIISQTDDHRYWLVEPLEPDK